MKRILVLLVMMLSSLAISAQNVVRIGIIGLDTSHSTAFTKLINASQYEWTEGFRVVAAYPYGSRTIKTSYERIPEYTETVKAYGVEITSSIAELLDKVDCVLLPPTWRSSALPSLPRTPFWTPPPTVTPTC